MDKQQAKLKKAKAKIEAVLKEYDLAGYVSLHAPGWGEVFWNIWPSYSILRGDFPTIRIVSKEADYVGKPGKQDDDQKYTVEMMHTLATSMGQCGMMFLELANVLNAKFDATHSDGPFIPDPSKLNPDVH